MTLTNTTTLLAFVACSMAFGQSPRSVIDASRAGDRAEVERLVAEGVSIDGLDSSILRYSALHWAVRADDSKRTVMLLELGADPDVRDGIDERAPMHVAASRCHPEAMIILLGKRAGINARDKHNWTPLHYAVDAGCVAAVRLLIRAGADLNARTSDAKASSALRMAKTRSYLIFQELKDAGAR